MNEIRQLRRSIEVRLKQAPPKTEAAKSAAQSLLASLHNVEETPGVPVLVSFLQQDLDAFERVMLAEKRS